MRNKLIPIVIALALSFSKQANAQMKVYVIPSTPDIVGGRLSYAIKEGIRRSSGMILADRDEDAALSISIVTLDPDRNTQTSSSRTIYSVVWIVKTLHATPVDMYLTHSVGVCGANKLAECADGLVADTDEQVTKVRGWLRSALERSNHGN